MASLPAETDNEAKVPAKAAVATGGKVAAFVPHTIEEAWRLSTALAQSGMTPKAYGSDPNKVMVGIMAGAEVGLTPFAALQSIAVIGNNPSLWGDGALALVQASGLLEDLEETDDGQAATCRAVRAGRSTPIVRTFSMDDAKKAGLASKAGPWTQYPARMRQMRARAFALRDGFPDVLKGLHIAEEVRDYTTMGGGEGLPSNEPLRAEHLLEQAKPLAEKPADEPEQAADQPKGNQPESGGNPYEKARDVKEGNRSEPDPAAKRLADVRAQIESADSLAAVNLASGEWAKHRVAYDDETIAEVDGLVSAAFKRVRGGEG